MARCTACARKVRRTHGAYALCRSCNARLESDIGDWAARIGDDLGLLERFDAFCAERDQSSKVCRPD